MNSPFPSLSRREFLKRTSAGAALLSTGAFSLARAAGANDRISIGLIGTGDRCHAALMKEILALSEKQNVEITAVCDVWQKNLQSAAGIVKEKLGQAPRTFTRFGDVLALKDIDAVVIATPDCAHGPILVASLQAGKDVYVEKPMSIELKYANRALDLARAGNRVVQVGTQKRSDGHFVAAAKEVQSGAIGKVNRISTAMNFNQARWLRAYEDCKEADVDWGAFMFCQPKKTAFDPKLLRRWQLYRRCSNGMAGLWMTHYADAVHLLTGARYPTAAVAFGGTYVWKERELADTFHALVDYPEEFLFSWSMALGNSAGTHFSVHGTQGTLDAEKWILSCEGGMGAKFESKTIAAVKVPTHMDNWLECLRSRERPAADIQYGHQHVVATVMAATACETGRRQKYNAEKRTISAA